MLRPVGLALCVVFLLSMSASEWHAQPHRRIEAFEVRPGILMLPKYATDGRVCEVALERLHYRDAGLVDLDSNISRTEVASILSELVPGADSKKLSGTGLDTVITQSSGRLITTTGLGDVVVEIYGMLSPTGQKHKRDVTEMVVQIKWKTRQCIEN